MGEEMYITSITPIQLMEFGTAEGTAQIEGQDGISAFKQIFTDAVNEVKTTENELAEEQYLLAIGETEDPHTVMIAAAEAQLATDMLVSLRTTALEAYNEIMRISL